MSTTWALAISFLLLAFNGFFVAAEFALVAAKRHRLEQAAGEGSRGARVALAGTRKLSMMLAGAQLGITLCTLGLGALAKPTVAHLLEPVFTAVGLPEGAAYAIAFILAVALVGFLHVVIGEMAPKSWAISHPESSAQLLAIPFVGFTTVLRPVLSALNGLANACLRLVKVTPQDELAQVHNPEQLRMLLQTSKDHGTIADAEHELLTAMLAVQSTELSQVMVPTSRIVSVDGDADARAVELRSIETGRSRLAVTEKSGSIVGVVHVRDAARATSSGDPATASTLMSPPLPLPADTSVVNAIAAMRQGRSQLALVSDSTGVVGLVTLEDLLEQVIGQFDDETDPVIAAASRAGRIAVK
ncbi:CBS domain containing-hemolysin-like protein [Actinoplanes lutulentus]|uniref:CBS domain containing-hemolysin-like protein n=1 Tax=Actinoplanes lutulentus TaxID=1287878 RepID=A0A327ZJA2_9ACTN|nr:hemolysin family protein [Actinoplanes lutulentus]MBB2940746.1 CBS domain containing-hemolysin-like protein [Actinoplanes lutulentus]RAK43057.1 CBS domain containing-hemolysin-like protein [Actinoplanes lutulentus]